MISLEQAQESILSAINLNMDEEEIDLLAARGRVLAEDVIATFNIPPSACSAMDGFAVMADDIAQADITMPVTLRVIGEVAAGQIPSVKLWSGEAVQIMTGAPIPEGTEVVVPVEDTRVEQDRVRILRRCAKGKNIRARGEDISQGDSVLKQGTWLRPVHIGLLASLGKNKVKVSVRPKIAILATGNELLEPGQPHQQDKIYSSNHYALASQVTQSGAEPVLLGIAPDNKEDLKELLARGLEYPILITSGGVSMGKYDLVKDVLEELGVKIKFWKVAIKPGKPTLFGTYNNNLVFGLPGYPVASMLCFEHFIRPGIAKILGSAYSPQQVEAVLEEDLRCKTGRKQFLRAHLRNQEGTNYVSCLKTQGSGILSTLSKANCLLIVPPDKDFIAAGQKVTVQLLGNM